MKVKKNVLNTIILSGILILFPLISWIYLKSGLDYRKQMLDELTPIGSMPDFAYESSYGTEQAFDKLRGKVLLMGYIEKEDEAVDAFMRVADQFDARSDFYSFIMDTITISDSFDVSRFFTLPDDPEWRWQLEESVGAPLNEGTAFLVDTALQVRRLYSLRDEQEVTKLVEHTAVLLPLKSKKRMRQ